MAETLDEVRANKDRHEIHVRLLTDRLDELDPHAGGYRYRRGGGIDWLQAVNPAEYGNDEHGRARFQRDFAAAEHADLRARWDVLTARADRRSSLAHARQHGIARFLDGGASELERLLAPARAHHAERYAASMGLETLHGAKQRLEGWEALGMHQRRPRT